ncbi:MAG: CPBP family intramembrane glutamic endopeptidase [Bdellovibrionales bacterium]
MTILKHKLLALEFLLLCICLPTVIIVFKLAPFMFFFLWGAALYCFFILRFRHKEYFRELWKWEAVTWAAMKPILVRFVFASIGMVAFIYFIDPDRMFGIIRERPQIIPFLLVMYPLISALPQEFIFCSFFFERYKKFFTSDKAMIIASAIVFAYAHVLYINWIAPFLSLIAGIIFATTYAKTKSLALVTIEHGLYGNVLFLVGLGWYFYGGAVVQ